MRRRGAGARCSRPPTLLRHLRTLPTLATLQVSAEPSGNRVKKPSRQSIAKPDQARDKIRGLVLNTLLFKGAARLRGAPACLPACARLPP